MALVGQVANVAQLIGVDAYGLITMIAEAALTVRRNRATCRQLARRVQMIGDLLRQLHAAQAPITQRPETRRPVEELEEILRRAYLLVRSCQRRSYMYRCFMGTRHAEELREVQGEIGFYLQLFPLVSYVDATLAWARLVSKADDPSCQEGLVVRQYFVRFLLLSWNGWCLEIVQRVCLDIAYPWFLSVVCVCNVLFSANAYNLVHPNNKVPGPQAQLPVRLNRSLSSPQRKQDE